MDKKSYRQQVKTRLENSPNKRIYPDRETKDTYISVSPDRIDLVVQGSNFTLTTNTAFFNTSKIYFTPQFNNVVFGMMNTINPTNIIPLPSSMVTPIPTSMFVNPIKFIN